MRKLNYYVILVVLIIAVVAFKVQSLEEEKPKLDIEEKILPEVKKINYALEIQDALLSFDSILSREIQESGTVGAAVVITYKNQIAFLKCFGVRKAGENEIINENTVFRLASVSKTITGVLAGILADENIIGLDDKIVDYLPEFKLKYNSSTRSLTVRNILSHTSGLIPHAYDNLIEEHVPFENVMIATSSPDFKPFKIRTASVLARAK